MSLVSDNTSRIWNKALSALDASVSPVISPTSIRRTISRSTSRLKVRSRLPSCRRTRSPATHPSAGRTQRRYVAFQIDEPAKGDRGVTT